MPGPPPKHPSQRRRRNAPEKTTTKLPAGGRKGRVPAWPLTKASAAERHIWSDVWKTPQAAVWERLGWTRTVARYVRILARAEEPSAGRDAMSEARQLEQQLGLTPMAMKHLVWEIAVDEVAETREARKASVRRLKAVDPRAVAGA